MPPRTRSCDMTLTGMYSSLSLNAQLHARPSNKLLFEAQRRYNDIWKGVRSTVATTKLEKYVVFAAREDIKGNRRHSTSCIMVGTTSRVLQSKVLYTRLQSPAEAPPPQCVSPFRKEARRARQARSPFLGNSRS
jgi:hypothetical protein